MEAENKYKIVAICGQAGAGKDTILNNLDAYEGHQKIVSCTTRPPREGEVDEIDYHFLTNEQFAHMIENGSMLEATVFNDWCYGTSKVGLNKDKWNIGVFNPAGIEILSENPEIELKVFYIYAPDKLRLMRQLTREDDPNVDEIIRRYQTDKKDFMFIDGLNGATLNNIAIGDDKWCAAKIADICGLRAI